MACNIYNGRSYTDNDGEAIAQYHYQVYDTLVSANNDLAKKPLKVLFAGKIQKDTYFLLPSGNLFNEARKLINSVNRNYGKVLTETKVKISGKMQKVAMLNVNPLSDQIIDRYNKVKDNEVNNNEFINDIGDILPYSTNDRRVLSTDVHIVNQARADQHATLMETKFEKLGVKSFIAYDTSMEESGKLLGTKDPLYLQLSNDNTLDGNTAIIVVNPNKLYSDTVFHEYGHLFLELLGGMNNSRIQDASRQLVGTAVEQQVKDSYPELSGDNLQKEIIATALGRKADILFAQPASQGWWKRFSTWVKNLINRQLGLPKDAILDLASELISEGTTTVAEQVVLAPQTQFQKETVKEEFKGKPVVERRLNTLANIRNQAKSIIASQLKSLPKHVSLNEANILYKQELIKIKAKMNDLDETEDAQAILSYLNLIDTYLANIAKFVQNDSITMGTQHATVINVLANFKKRVASFGLVADIQDSLNKQLLAEELSHVSESDRQLIKSLTDDLSARYNTLSDKITAISTNHVAGRLVKLSNKSTIIRREQLEIEFQKNNKKAKSESSKDYENRKQEYIEGKIELERDDLEKQEYANLVDRLNNSPADINKIAAWFSDEKDLNSPIIQLVSKLLDDADIQRNQASMAKQKLAQKAFDSLRKNANGVDPKKIYEGYYEEGSDGNLYITSQYSVEFYIQHRSLQKSKSDAAQKFGLKSEEYKAASKKVNLFIKNNTVDGIIKSKWKNANFEKVSSTESYQFLIDTTKEIDEKLNGTQSNIKTFANTKFFQVPNIGKQGFEQISSGNLLDNIWESAQRIWKKRADTQEFGNISTTTQTRAKELMTEIERRIAAGEPTAELSQEINTLHTMTDELGDIKKQVPIFFRGQHNLKDQTYDLMSAVLMDFHMAENFHQKERVKDTVELTLDITNAKQITQTQGMMNRVNVHLYGEDVLEQIKKMKGIDSNEAKVLKSIIENRLYGIKTIDNDFAQLASSLMAWTGSTMLNLNFLSAGANLLQGKVYNFIESVGAEWFTMKDIIAGEKIWWSDLKDNLDDVGRAIHTSKTNQLLNLLDIQGDFKELSNRFTEDARYKSLMKNNSLAFAQHMGEFYIHGTLMYSILNNIKVKGKSGQYINSKGKVTSKEKAMNLNEAFSVNNKGDLVLNEHVHKTSFGNQILSMDLNKDKGMLEVKNMVNKIANDLHGQYNAELQSMAQRHVIGKMAFMLRKWIVRAFNRRWRGGGKSFKRKELLRPDVDRFYSEDLQSFQEGYYTSFIRFLTTLGRDFKRLGLQGAYTHGMDNLTTHEKANLRRTSAEIGMIMLTLIMSLLMFKLLDGIDDDDDKGLLYLAFASRRLYSELAFFISPLETFQILKSPAASVFYAQNLAELMGQFTSDGIGLATGQGLEIYERGRHKGLPKLWKRTTDVLPVFNQLDRTVHESTSYLYNSR